MNYFQFCGQVSSLHSGYGLIDGTTYFTLDSVVDGVMPREGASVEVTARRKHGDGGWIADKVRAMEQGEDKVCFIYGPLLSSQS